MRILIIQKDPRCSEAIAETLVGEVPSLEKEQVDIIRFEKTASALQISDFIFLNREAIELVILDAHLQLSADGPYVTYGGLTVYRQIVERGLHQIRVLLTFFELTDANLNLEHSDFLSPEWLKFNPRIQLPVSVGELIKVVQKILEGGV
jgi:hypothetical protein